MNLSDFVKRESSTEG